MSTSGSLLLVATDVALRDAAFGTAPGRSSLPAATDALGSWYRSVALAGQGRYAAARNELRRFRPESAALASLHESTRASWLRQLGRHHLARRHDGRAVLLIGLYRPATSDDVVEARCDALTGLAADALGVGRFDLAATMLTRCAEQQEAVPGGRQLWRPALRAAWVSAELAMMRGDGDGAIRHAEAARSLAESVESSRHRVKTDLVMAAALSCAGMIVGARDAAVRVASAAHVHGLLPLQWAATMLCEGTGGVDPVMPTSLDLRAVIAGRGGSTAR